MLCVCKKDLCSTFSLGFAQDLPRTVAPGQILAAESFKNTTEVFLKPRYTKGMITWLVGENSFEAKEALLAIKRAFNGTPEQ